jgi:hypothetical protein
MKGAMDLKKEKESKQLSYESDGKMGNRSKDNKHKKEQRDFFNTTQDSE